MYLSIASQVSANVVFLVLTCIFIRRSKKQRTHTIKGEELLVYYSLTYLVRSTSFNMEFRFSNLNCLLRKSTIDVIVEREPTFTFLSLIIKLAFFFMVLTVSTAATETELYCAKEKEPAESLLIATVTCHLTKIQEILRKNPELVSHQCHFLFKVLIALNCSLLV